MIFKRMILYLRKFNGWKCYLWSARRIYFTLLRNVKKCFIVLCLKYNARNLCMHFAILNRSRCDLSIILWLWFHVTFSNYFLKIKILHLYICLIKLCYLLFIIIEKTSVLGLIVHLEYWISIFGIFAIIYDVWSKLELVMYIQKRSLTYETSIFLCFFNHI